MAGKRSYAAFAAADKADAKRGYPEVSLESWAHRRGLTFMGSSLPGQFANVMPLWIDYVFNLCRGTLAPGHYGYLAHELEEVPQDPSGNPMMQGGYHGLRSHGRRGLLNLLFGIEGNLPNEPFANPSFWIPVTTVGVRVPEAVLLPAVTIRSADRFALLGNPKLDDAGLPGYRMAGSEWIDDPLRLAIGRAVAPLGHLDAAFVALRSDRGVIAVRRNGFVRDEAELDRLTSVATSVAAGLASLGRTMTAPQPFDVPLPPPDIASWPPGCIAPEAGEIDALGRAAAELGLVQEDPIAFHRANPRCPVPGRAMGMFRGTVPTSNVEGRVGVFLQGRKTWDTYRTALAVPARAGATTPLGGTHDQESDLYVEVADGIAYAWPRVRSVQAFRAADTVAAAVQVLRRLGLADL